MVISGSVYDFAAKDLRGNMIQLAEFRGQVLLVVNVASLCTCASQLAGFQELVEQYGTQGFQVLAFPCNQFGFQEPANDSELERHYRGVLGLTFRVFAKVEVNGPHTPALWSFLKEAAPEPSGSRNIPWNFTKFLISRTGTVLGRFSSITTPEELAQEIEMALAEGSLPTRELSRRPSPSHLPSNSIR